MYCTGNQVGEGTAGLKNSEWWNILRSTEEQLLNDDFQSADDISWTVPQLLPAADITGQPYSVSGSSSPTGIDNNSLQQYFSQFRH